jgi:hypothetical protein
MEDIKINDGIAKYEFSAKVQHYSTSGDLVGWTIVLLPKEISVEIRDIFKRLEQGWGRLKVTAKVGKSEWKTAIWFDTKQDTYLLPLKAVIRKKEKITLDKNIDIIIGIK